MPLQVETTATAEGSTVARLGRTVEAAAAQRSPLEGAVARFAKYYTPAVLVAALLIAFVPWATNSSKSHKVLLQTCYAAICFPTAASQSSLCCYPMAWAPLSVVSTKRCHATEQFSGTKTAVPVTGHGTRLHTQQQRRRVSTADGGVCPACSTGCTWRCRSW